MFSLAGLTLIAAMIVFVQHLSLRPRTTTASIPSAQSTALPLPDTPSIAVLPFVNMSGDPDQEYFSDGITDDLTTALSRIPDLFVIARTSTFSYKGKAVKVQDVSRELGVKYVLEGSVRKADNQVRITAQLVDATTGDHIWAEYYDRPLRNIFSLQDEIVRRIVTTLNLQLTLEERGLLFKKRTDNLEAYDDFLRALEYSLSMTKDGDEKARQALEKAIALDPKYSDAYAELAWVYFRDFIFQWNRDPHVVDQMFQAGQQAVTFDDTNAFAYTVLSAAYMWSKRNYDQSLTAAQRAIAIDPNSARGYASLASTLESSGRPVEGIRAAQKAIRLDPRNDGWPPYLGIEGIAYALMGRYEEAIPVFKEQLARHPNDLVAHNWLAACYIEVGRVDDARAEAAEVMRINPDFSLEYIRRHSVWKEGPMRDRFFGDLAKAGLK